MQKRGWLISIVLLLASTAFAGNARAEIVDDVVLKTDANGDVDAYVKFIVPVRYIRHFPHRKSPYVAIYFDILDSVPRDEWQNYESHRSPPSDLIAGFTITTRDLSTGPKIEVQFKRPLEFSRIYEGADGRSIVIHIKPGIPQQKESGSKQAMPATVAPIAAASPPAEAVQFSAPQPVQSVPVASPPIRGARIIPASRLGQGLPVFPALEISPAPQAAGNASTEITPLSEQIRIANAQAAELMLKGRDAIVAGKMFAAVDAFNNVLKLPTNKYTQDAQVWIGIAREKGGQIDKAELEFETYLKLYPNGSDAHWVRERLALLYRIHPPKPAAVAPATATMPAREPPKVPEQPLNWTEYGSLSMYYYNGNSQTNTVTTVGTTQTPSSLSVTDQSSLITNVMATARSYNNEYDNRLVIQDFYSKNFLNTPGSTDTNRLNALYGEWKDRLDNAYLRLGRQSALGGGVMGRFDGAAGGYGTSSDWRANIAAGHLSDETLGPKPVFYSFSLDFGINDPVGGSLYTIKQTVGGVLDRKAVGGMIRYFDPHKTALSMFDYDTQFNQWNMITLQGTVNSDSGTDYNFLLDHRRSPSISIRNAVNGTTATLDTLIQNGWTQTDLIALAKSRNAVSNTAQVGMTYHIREKLQSGTDIIVSNTTAVPESGTLNPDGTTGLEGFVAASPGSGNSWTLSERLIANGFITSNDVSMASLSFNKSHLLTGKSLTFNNHSTLQGVWTLDPALRFYWQSDNTGGKESIISPSLRIGYQVRNSLTLETEGGIEWTDNRPSTLVSSKITRKYFSLGFRWDF